MLPGLHLLHVSWPSIAANDPGAQRAHTLSFGLQCLPGWHGTKTTTPEFDTTLLVKIRTCAQGWERAARETLCESETLCEGESCHGDRTAPLQRWRAAVDTNHVRRTPGHFASSLIIVFYAPAHVLRRRCRCEPASGMSTESPGMCYRVRRCCTPPCPPTPLSRRCPASKEARD